MNSGNEKYSKYALVKEMFDTCDIIKNFDVSKSKSIADELKKSKKLFLTGEGSSRILPAKNAMYFAKKNAFDVSISTDGGYQAMEYNLNDYVVVCASNSGKTKEMVKLINKLNEDGQKNIYGLSANDNTPVLNLAKKGFLLECGVEKAVGATKSVVEQALFQMSILENCFNTGVFNNLSKLADVFKSALTLNIDEEIVKKISNASVVYFAGRNNGVAEELALKTNEIARKKSDYLEGTYVVHGIEEVMDSNEVVILIDPFEDEMQKYHDVLVKGVGMTVVAISSKETVFPTIVIPEVKGFNEFVQIATGWNLLVETGISLGINLDKPVRARKIGNVL